MTTTNNNAQSRCDAVLSVMRPVRHRILSQVVGPLFVAVAAILMNLASSPSALASCGDYLYRNGRPVSDHTMPMDDHQRMIGQDDTADGTPMQLPVRRCNGPHCSGSPVPLIPMPAAPSNLVQGSDQAAILEALVRTDSSRGCAEIPQSEVGSCFEPSGIFRPPAA